MRSLALIAALGLGLPMTALGQVPTHATWLNPTTQQQYLLALHDGDDVHVLGLGPPALNQGLRYARSRDGGRTWPLREVALGGYLEDTSFAATLAGPGVLIAVGSDQSVGPVYWRSADGGTTWSSTAPLFAVASPPGTGTVAALADGLDVVVLWLRGNQLNCRRSLDGGVVWQPAQQVSAYTNGGSFLHCFRNGGVIDVLWNSGSTGAVRQRSTDGGSSWLPTETLVAPSMQTATSNGTHLMVRPSVGNSLLHSADGGATWVPKTIPGMPFPQRFAQEGTRMAAVGTEQFSGLGANTYVVSVSNDGGLTWPASPLQLPSPVSWQTQVLVEDGVVYVRFYPGDTLGVVTSRDGGNTWQLVGGSVSGGLWPGPRRNVHLVTTYSPPTTYGNFHVYVGLGSSTLGTGTPGAGGIVPRLEANGLPFQGAVTTLQLTHAVGGSLGALGISFAAPMPVPLGGAVLWPAVAPIVLPFATGGTAGAAGSGNHSLAIAIPVDAALVGASFTSQALVLDTANIDGFAVSNGLETWLR